MNKLGSQKWAGNVRVGAVKRLGKGIFATALSAFVAVSMMPAAAFASVDGDSVYYTLPTASQVKSLTHTATGANGSTYTYKYASTALTPIYGGYGESTYYVLGVNGTNFDRGIRSGKVTSSSLTDGKLMTDATTAVIGLYGTNVNSNPDEYLWNYCCYLNGASVPDNQRTYYNTYNGTVRPSAGSAYVINVTVDGVEYSMPVAIYMEATLIDSANTPLQADKGIKELSDWVTLENSRSSSERPYNQTYNPTFLTWSTGSGGAATVIKSMYTIAQIFDDQIKASQDSNGNYTIKTRYVEGPNTYTIVQDFEDIAQASQYYLLSKFADGSLTKKTAAVVCGYDPTTGKYACRIFDTNGAAAPNNTTDPDTNAMGGRFSNCIQAVANSITSLNLETNQEAVDSEKEFVKWYDADQIIANADAVFVSEYPANNTQTYAATASDGNKYPVYSETGQTGDTNDNMAALKSAQSAAKNAGKHYADLCYKYPDHAFGVYYAQGCENVLITPVALCFMYPTEFNITDTMAWWAKHIWHISDGSLQEVVDSTCHNISLATNQVQLGTISANYETEIAEKLNAGNWYYLHNTDAIDAINSGNLKTYDLAALTARTTEPAAKKSSNNNTASTVKAGTVVKVGKASYKVTNVAKKTVSFQKNSSKAATVTIGKTVKIKGVTYSITGIAAKAFKGTKAKTVKIKTKSLSKASVKNCFKGSKVTTVKAGAKAKAYKKIFTKKNCGKKVTVKK